MSGPALTIKYLDGRAPVSLAFPESQDPFAILERVFKQFPQDNQPRVAQSAERGARNYEVVGSTPTGGSHTVGVRHTSRDAYSGIKTSGKLTAQQERIVEFLRHHPGAWTRSEIADKIHMRINSCTGRINELVKLYVVQETGVRRCCVTGERAHQLRLR